MTPEDGAPSASKFLVRRVWHMPHVCLMHCMRRMCCMVRLLSVHRGSQAGHTAASVESCQNSNHPLNYNQINVGHVGSLKRDGGQFLFHQGSCIMLLYRDQTSRISTLGIYENRGRMGVMSFYYIYVPPNSLPKTPVLNAFNRFYDFYGRW